MELGVRYLEHTRCGGFSFHYSKAWMTSSTDIIETWNFFKDGIATTIIIWN